MKRGKTSDTQREELSLALCLVIRRIRAKGPAELRSFSWTQKSVLSRLEKEGPATSAELARAEGVSPQSMGTAIVVLKEMGLVEREAHPKDGRQMVVKLTAKGISLRKHTKVAKDTWFTHALEQLDERELVILFKAGEIMKRMAEKH